MCQNNKDISHLIAQRILEVPLSEEDNRRLDEWLRASEENRNLYEQIRSKQLARLILRLQHEDYGEKWQTAFRVRYSAGNGASAYFGGEVWLLCLCCFFRFLFIFGASMSSNRFFLVKAERC